MAEIAPIHFEAGNVDINLSAPTAPESVALALAQDTAFPDDAFQNGAISLGEIKAAVSHDFTLDEATFKASAGAFAGFGVYRDSGKLFAALKAEGLDEPMVTNLSFPADLDLYALRWGYDLSGSVNGTVALGPAGVSFGASGRKEGLYAVLRALERTTHSRQAVAKTVNSWKMPRQVSVPGDLEPQTWLIAETDGEIKLSLGVEYGYNYNWVRESLALGQLAGDIGLKIEVGLSASLGFNASNRHAIVLMREGDGQQLRLQVFKLGQHGWNFAVNAGVSAQVQQTLIPENLNDFFKGVFNLQGSQIFKDIETLLDPANSLSQLLSSRLVEYFEHMVESITGVTPSDIDHALDQLREPITRWHALPHEVTSILYNFLRSHTPLNQLTEFLQTLINQTDSEVLANEITERLKGNAFFSTTVGKWLTAAAKEGILSLLANIDDEKAELADLARKTLAILDGSSVEETLTKLQEWFETKLGLDNIFAIANEASFEQMDAWLKQRLSDFLGRTIVFADLEKIKTAINKLREKAGDFYGKGYKALMDKYKVDLEFTYQKTTTRTALLDVTFDFDVNAVNARNYLSESLNGDFTRLLTDLSPTSGVRINKGVLTHEIKRNTHIGVELPFYKFSLDHINESLASGEVVDAADGRLWVFNLKAQDTVTKKSMMSKLSVAMSMTTGARVRRFSDEDYKYNYVLRMTKHDARPRFMEQKFGRLVEEYLGSEFTGDGRSFPEYLNYLDGILDSQGATGTGRLGNVLVGFDISVPSRVFSAWNSVPADKLNPVYTRMSLSVQALLRRWIPLCYLREAGVYQNIQRMYPLLAYCSLPPINRVTLDDGALRFTTNRVLDWEYTDEKTRMAVLRQYGVAKLQDEILPRVRADLEEMSQDTHLYRDDMIEQIITSPGKSEAHWQNFLGLMITESEIVTGIHHAALDYRKFLDTNNLEVAIEKLAEFGAKLTSTFNYKVGNSNYAADTLRPLGSLLFIEVCKLFDPTVADSVTSAAVFELLVLKDQSTFLMDDFLKGNRPEDTDLALQQRIVKV